MTAATIARAIPRSKNGKIGDVAATYVSQASCPTVCPLRGSGCYAEGGRAGITTRRLNDADPDATALDCARAEAAEIDRLPDGGRDLRLHVVGDCPTNGAAKIVAAAAARYVARGGGSVWTYTHAWRKVHRASWGDVSVMASVETMSDAILADAAGYAVAMVVPEHDGDRAVDDGGFKVVPCPEQTGRGVTCVDCRLCMGDGGLRDRTTPAIIALAIHGQSKRRAVDAIAS
jgi:hypothetical protein